MPPVHVLCAINGNAIIHALRYSNIACIERTYCCKDTSSLVASHDADACIWPHVQEVGTVCTATHTIVAGPKTSTDENRQLGNLQQMEDNVDVLSWSVLMKTLLRHLQTSSCHAL